MTVAFLAGLAAHQLTATSHRAPAGAPDTAEPTRPAGRSTGRAGPGPRRVVRGVGAGFSRDRAGAVAAAATFVCSGQVLLDLDPLAAEEAVRQMASTATADRQVVDTLEGLRGLRAELASGAGPAVYRQAAVAWRVESFTRRRARVAVWNVGVLARPRVVPPQAGWAVSTFDLVWERGDWRVRAETVVPGPAPMADDSAAPATAGQFTAALRGFTDFGGAR